MRDAYYHGVMAKLDKCPFCDLREKYIITERSGMVLTVNLFPYTDYHLMIVSRRHIEALADLNKKEWDAVLFLSKLGFDLISRAWGEKKVNILYREGRNSGKSLGHWHWHLIPFVRESFSFKKFDVKQPPLKSAQRLRRFLKNYGSPRHKKRAR